MIPPLKENKFMSTRDIYFLPIIHDPRLDLTKRSIHKNINRSKSKQKSLEEILQDKSNISHKQESSIYENCILRRTEIANNLYNKYDELPKIFAKINRKKHPKKLAVAPTRKTFKNIIEDHINQNQPKQTKANDQNSFSFQSSFYKQDFNKKLQKQIEQLQFNLDYNYSHNTMLMYNQLTEDTPSSIQIERRPKKKFTKMETTQDESPTQNELKRVPSFLMKLIDSCKPISTNQ